VPGSTREAAFTLPKGWRQPPSVIERVILQFRLSTVGDILNPLGAGVAAVKHDDPLSGCFVRYARWSIAVH
jgi:hypothetical protein